MAAGTAHGPVHHAAPRRTLTGRARRGLEGGFDRFLGSDPGLTRLRTAGLAVLGIGIALLAEDVFVRLTHALQLDTHGATLPASQAALVAEQHHGVLVLALLFGAIMALLFSFAADSSPAGLTLTTVLMPLPIVATFAVALSLVHHRLAGLALLPVALAIGTYARRWGPRGFLGGQLLFMGSFMGFLIGSELKLSQLGWVAAELGLGAVVGLLVRLTLFYPRPTADLRRSQRSWIARGRRVLDLAAVVVETRDTDAADRLRRQLHRQLARLNESSLIIDALITAPDAMADESAASRLHQQLFDLELGLSNVARFAEALSRSALPAGQRAAIRTTLLALRTADQASAQAGADAVLEYAQPLPGRRTGTVSAIESGLASDAVTATVLAHRFAGSAGDLIGAQTAWLGLGEQVERDKEHIGFSPAVALFNGWLPGSAMVSAQASSVPRATTGRRRVSDRIALPAYVRTAIQIGIAVTGAIVAGDALSGRRFYWAVLAAFVTFMATSNSGEQVRKAFLRLLGTAIGIVLGIVLVHVTHGHSAWSLVVVLVSLFLALYLIRISYLFMVLGITVTVSQLYVQLDEFSDSLLLLRLEETAIGFGVVVLTVLLVLPLRPIRVLQTAAVGSVTALGEALEAATDLFVEGTDPARLARLRDGVRGVDAAYQTMLAVTQPMRRLSFGGSSELVARATSVSAATRYYTRSLVSDLDDWAGLPEAYRDAGRHAAAAMLQSVGALSTRLESAQGGTYIRTAALFDDLTETGPRAAPSADRLAIRDLTLIDGALAQAAAALGMTVTDHDTTDEAPVPDEVPEDALVR